MIMTMITEILWLATALAVFSSVVLFVLNPLYAFWIENKYHMDLESELYQKVSEAVEMAEEDGLQISIKFLVGEPEVEEASKEKD
jgi:hypothetical protein|tara:strand:+ start:54 stop:308 length:255 start_codon:yes stop_codon:yes gene_type:complete